VEELPGDEEVNAGRTARFCQAGRGEGEACACCCCCCGGGGGARERERIYY
jgi:hypothetical protein